MKRPLRIFLSCHQDLEGEPHAIPSYRFWRGYFASAFAEDGHTLLETPSCDWALGLLPLSSLERHAWRETTWNKTLDYIRREHSREPIDLFLSYLYPQQIDEGAVKEIRSLQIPTINFFCDNVREFRHIPSAFHNFDLNWVPEKEALPLYEKDNLPTLYGPMPCWVEPNLRGAPADTTSQIAFIGRRDELRARLLAEACQLGLNPILYGPGWLDAATSMPESPNPRLNLLRNQWAFIKQHGIRSFGHKIHEKLSPLPVLNHDFSSIARRGINNEDYFKLTRESLVCLGINRYPSPRNSSQQPETYSRLRDIEAPMVGACYLTEWTEGLPDLYELGKEVETYRDAQELVEKAQALSANPQRCAAMRFAAQKRALGHHSISHTIDRIGSAFGIS